MFPGDYTLNAEIALPNGANVPDWYKKHEDFDRQTPDIGVQRWESSFFTMYCCQYYQQRAPSLNLHGLGLAAQARESEEKQTQA